MPPVALFRLLASEMRSVRTLFRAVTVAIAMAMAAPAGAQEDKPGVWSAGAYTFSDEMGGFTIEGVSGTGQRDDPIVIRETFNSSSPVTLVIRARRPIRHFDSGAFYANGILHMRIQVRNGSGQGWVEFEFELQELLHQASVFGDGLSFDQRSARSEYISSDAFAEYSRDFEPYDKLRFRDGKVDPRESGSFSFLITDFTPRSQFYLVQDPRIPST